MVFVNKAVLNSTPDLPFTFLVRTIQPPSSACFPKNPFLNSKFPKLNLNLPDNVTATISIQLPTYKPDPHLHADHSIIQFIQLLIAVILLHSLSFLAPPSLKSKVALPDLDPDIAYKLLPVVAVGITALIFNTLCLRDVDASFFQVSPTFLGFSFWGQSNRPSWI